MTGNMTGKLDGSRIYADHDELAKFVSSFRKSHIRGRGVCQRQPVA
jgi:hypothetical protein